MKVSVIIPNYNYARYLRLRIDSVLQQTYQNFEIILLDDASIDNSREIIESYRGNQKVSRIVYNDVNSGSTFKQWKKGIEMATGNLIWIAESDDYAHPDFLQEMVRVFYLDKSVVIAACDSYIIDGEGNITSAVLDIINREQEVVLIDGKEYIRKQMLYTTKIYNASSVLFRRDVCCDSDIERASSFRLAGDWYIWVALLNQGKVGRIHRCYNYLRKHSLSVSTKAFSDGFYFSEGLMVLQYILSIVSVPKKVELRVAGYFFHFMMLYKNDAIRKLWTEKYNLFICLSIYYILSMGSKSKKWLSRYLFRR
ncbi:MAG: glycosyltransferase [Prevotellaceae bacterium]|jgi:glycosyltransferase involved in cell wall biosynthesis|nr:glycosyltransferase [Prevotellaceae bacterium]